MRRWVWPALLGALALLAAAGWIVQAIRRDPDEIWEELGQSYAIAHGSSDAVWDHYHPDSTHRGPLPCLRSPKRKASAREVDAALAEWRSLGLGYADLPPSIPLFLTWATAEESILHDESMWSELLDVYAQDVAAEQRVLIALNRPRLAKHREETLAAHLAPAVVLAERHVAALPPPARDGIRPFWERHKAVLTLEAAQDLFARLR